MGQLNLQEEILAAIRRKKKLYIKMLEITHSIDDRNDIKHKLNILSEEEQRILNQLMS